MLANPVSVVMLLSGGFYMSIQSLPPVSKAPLLRFCFPTCMIYWFSHAEPKPESLTVCPAKYHCRRRAGSRTFLS